MKEAPQALFNDAEVLAVDRHLVEQIKHRARESPTLRYRLCMHHSTEDAVQEMLVVHCRGNYSRPHRHPPGMTSVRLVLEGASTIYVFDEDGTVRDAIELEAYGRGKPFAIHLHSAVWYMPFCRSDQVVCFEAIAGPFDPVTANEWAPWSPAEDDSAGIALFLERLSLARPS